MSQSVKVNGSVRKFETEFNTMTSLVSGSCEILPVDEIFGRSDMWRTMVLQKA